jgi:RNA-binding protein YlmH
MTENSNFTIAEKDFVSIANSLIKQAIHSRVLTHFLNPREQEIIKQLVNRENIIVNFFGGYENAEKKRAILSPNFDNDNHQISLLEINYADKFNDIYHSTILGSLVHNGINFDSIGDIIHQGNRWQILVESQLAPIISSEIKHIGKKSATFENISINEIINPDIDGNIETILVSSLRLDLLISETIKISRSQAKELVESGQVRLNYFDFTNSSYQVKFGDLISIHGHGRIKLLESLGTTNRNKYRVNILKITR